MDWEGQSLPQNGPDIASVQRKNVSWSNIIEKLFPASQLCAIIVSKSRESRISRICLKDQYTRNLASDRMFFYKSSSSCVYCGRQFLWRRLVRSEEIDETIARSPKQLKGHVWKDILFRALKSFYTLLRRFREESNAHERSIGDRDQVSLDKMYFLKTCFKIGIDRSYAQTKGRIRSSRKA